MINLARNDLLKAKAAPFPQDATYRVIWEDRAQNIAVLLRIDEGRLKKPTSPGYSTVVGWIDAGLLEKIPPLKPTAILNMNDEDLRTKFPAKKNRKPEKRAESFAVNYRTKWLAVLDDITPNLEDVWTRNKKLLGVVSKVAAKHGVAQNETYQVLYRFLANACNRKSVVPRTHRCGGKGTQRVGKGYVLGRKKTDTKRGNRPNDNFSLDHDWILKIQDVFRETLAEGVTGNDAYQEFLNVHCIRSATTVDDELHIEYLPLNERPSKNTFFDWGPKDDPHQAISIKQLADKEWEKNFRGLDGNAAPATFQTGILAEVDSSSNDRYLVSVFDARRVVGTARALPVVDAAIGYVFGIHVAWSINGAAAKLAVANAASEKVEFCARYGIKIQPRDWYACLHAKYRADRGEFNAKVPREALGSLQCSLEYVMTGRPDLRGTGEQTHSRLHDFDADGTTFGRLGNRGEKHPASKATQNIFQYYRELIRLILWHNNEALVPHLLTTEMRRDGVRPTRRDILEWSIRKGYHHQIPYHDDNLALALCAEFDATVTENGIYPLVRRAGDSGDLIILHELRYLGDFAIEQGWLERARRSGRWRIKLRINPNIPGKAWYLDPDSDLKTFHLATKDPLLSRLATIHDLVDTRTDEIGDHRELKDRAAQAAAKMRLQNQSEREVQKAAMQEATEQQPSHSSTASGRRANKQAEAALGGNSPMPFVVPSETATAPEAPQLPAVAPPMDTDETDDVSEMLDKWLKG